MVYNPLLNDYFLHNDITNILRLHVGSICAIAAIYYDLRGVGISQDDAMWLSMKPTNPQAHRGQIRSRSSFPSLSYKLQCCNSKLRFLTALLLGHFCPLIWQIKSGEPGPYCHQLYHRDNGLHSDQRQCCPHYALIQSGRQSSRLNRLRVASRQDRPTVHRYGQH